MEVLQIYVIETNIIKYIKCAQKCALFFIPFNYFVNMYEDADIGKLVCKYIYTNWIMKSKSQREFAILHGIEESTVRRIKNIALDTTKTEYNMSLNTLFKICQKRDITLADFFKMVGI